MIGYKKLQEDIKKRDITAASNSLEYFRIVVLTSNDLIFSDAQKIVDQVKKNTIAILPTVSVSTHGIIELPDLHTYQIY
jgi:hypothetical protein